MLGLLHFVLAILVLPFRSKVRLEAKNAVLRPSAPPEASDPRGKHAAAKHLANIRAALVWSFSDRGDSDLSPSLPNDQARA